MRFVKTFFGVLVAVAAAMPAFAGGPVGAVGSTPSKYKADMFPLEYLTDRGNLGIFSTSEATTIANFAFSTWQDLSTALLSFRYLGQLERDVSSSTDPYISGPTQFSDGIFPVVFDTDGSITDARIGVGASQQIFGFATSFTQNGVDFQEGFVLINGRLSDREGALQIYREVVTHEIGHMLGISHSQIGLHADYSLMYPSTLTFDDVLSLKPDDAAAMSVLYPAAGYLNSVGTIAGTITDQEGNILSGVNVVAVNAANGDVYSTVSDYYSGDNGRFVNSFSPAGSYRIEGLPPGEYYVRIEPINPYFTGGSLVASYETPVNTDVWREWYNGENESGNMLTDNSNEKTAVTVTAAGVAADIDIVANGSPTLSTLTEHSGADFQSVTLPLPAGNATLTRFATRYTAPVTGSVVGVRFRTLPESVMPTDATLVVTVYEDQSGSINGIPGRELGSVSIPFTDLVADQWNEIWLREIGENLNFLQGEKFHIAIRIEGDGRLDLVFDDAANTKNQTSYFVEEFQTWRNFPDGLNGADGVNLHMSAIYSTVPAGVPVPLIDVAPTAVNFGGGSVGKEKQRDITVRNIGTAKLDISNVRITGSNAASFSVISGGGAFSLEPGQGRIVTLGFTPQAMDEVQALLQFTHNATGSPSVVTLRGSGRQAVVSPLTELIDFDTVNPGRTYQQDVTLLENTGSDTLRISSIEISGEKFFANAQGGIPAAIAPGESFGARVFFVPSTAGTYSGTLSVNHDLDSGPLEIDLLGVAMRTDTGAGVSSELTSNGLRVRLLPIGPNPVLDRVVIGWSAEGDGRIPLEIAVVDMTGRAVLREDRTAQGLGADRTESTTFDLRGLPAGEYLAVLRSGGRTAVRKFVVLR